MSMEQQASLLKSLIQRPQEYLVGFGVVVILAVMLMPIPPVMLDLLLSCDSQSVTLIRKLVVPWTHHFTQNFDA